jgi:2-amino-4-hydroxy-6-hydroxymethyldihydropteridine diphosphokinase
VGSNLDPERRVRQGLDALRREFGELRVSPAYRTPAEGFVGPDFINLVVAFHTAQLPGRVQQTLRQVERECGRSVAERGFCDRTLDLDLLLYGDMVRHDDIFNLPRPDLGQYAFVLGPMADLAPDLRHPETGTTIARMWQAFAGRRAIEPIEL